MSPQAARDSPQDLYKAQRDLSYIEQQGKKVAGLSSTYRVQVDPLRRQLEALIDGTIDPSYAEMRLVMNTALNSLRAAELAIIAAQRSAHIAVDEILKLQRQQARGRD